jgi:hypothetical protein
MTLPFGWKNTSTKVTLAEYLKNQKELSFELQLATAAVTFYSAGEKLGSGSTVPYTPTGYNFVTGEVMVEEQVKERQEIMRKGREAAYGADDIYKGIIDSATKNAIRGDLHWPIFFFGNYIV